MTVRLYLTSSNAAYTPPQPTVGAWDNRTQVAASLMSPVRSGFASNRQQAVGSLTPLWDVVLRRFVSNPLTAAGALGGTLDYCMSMQQEAVALNAAIHLHVYVTAGDTATVRGTLLATHIGPALVGNAMVAYGETGVALSPVACQPSDRVVAVWGYRASSNATARLGYLRHAGTAATADLTPGTEGATSFPPWMQFSDLIGDATTLTIDGAPPSPTGPEPGRLLLSV